MFSLTNDLFIVLFFDVTHSCINVFGLHQIIFLLFTSFQVTARTLIKVFPVNTDIEFTGESEQFYALLNGCSAFWFGNRHIRPAAYYEAPMMSEKLIEKCQRMEFIDFAHTTIAHFQIQFNNNVPKTKLFFPNFLKFNWRIACKHHFHAKSAIGASSKHCCRKL